MDKMFFFLQAPLKAILILSSFTDTESDWAVGLKTLMATKPWSVSRSLEKKVKSFYQTN